MSSVIKFKQNIDRDAQLVYAGMLGGFSAVCSQAMQMPEFNGGPDVVLEHSEWLKKQPKSYIAKVANRIDEIEREKE